MVEREQDDAAGDANRNMLLDHVDVDDWRAPEGPLELELAETRLLKDLDAIAEEIPGDLWIIGQRVYYLTDVNAHLSAADLARHCGGRAHWWCAALIGYVHHSRGLWTLADEVFALALDEMPADTAALWRSPEALLEESALEVYDRAADKQSLDERLWLLSDPLYLVEGNDRKTEQFARQVLIRLGAEAVNGTGLEWDDDLKEITLRWGAPEGWSRERDLPTGDTLVDSRRMVSHRRGQEFLPPAQALEGAFATCDAYCGARRRRRARSSGS